MYVFVSSCFTFAPQFAIVASNAGICIGYLVFIGETLVHAGFYHGADIESSWWDHYLFGEDSPIHLNMFLAVICPFICALSVIKPSRLAFSSSVGNVAVFTCIIVVMYFSANHLSVAHVDPDWSFVHASTLPIFFGIRYVMFWAFLLLQFII